MRSASLCTLLASLASLGTPSAKLLEVVPAPPVTPLALRLFFYTHGPFGIPMAETLQRVTARFGSYVRLELAQIVDDDNDSYLFRRAQRQQACALRRRPAPVAFIACHRRRAFEADGASRCAHAHKLDAAELDACASSPRSRRLLDAAAARARRAGVRASPTLFIGDERYHQTRSRSERALTRALCHMLGADAPSLCAAVPEPPRVDIVVIAEPTGSTAYIRRMRRSLGRYLRRMTFEIVTPGSRRARLLYPALAKSLGGPPVWLFRRQQIERVEDYARLKRWLTSEGLAPGYLRLQVAHTWRRAASSR